MKRGKKRAPTKKKMRKTSPPVPIVSLRKEERKLLKAMSDGKRLNVNGYSDRNKIARSTTRTRIKKLARLGLVGDKEAHKSISKRGLIYLENTNQIEKQGVGTSRMGGRKDELSTHWHKFTLPISNKLKFREERLNQLNHNGIKENILPNLRQKIITLDDATIIINPKQVIISLYDVVTKDVEDSDIKCLTRAVEYAEKLKKFGLETEGIMIERGHWARVDSALSNFIKEKVDGRYFLELSDGSKFWIDNSPDKYGNRKSEDETDSKLVRERVDNFLDKIGTGDIDLNDINKIKDSLGFITKLESSRLMDKVEENKLKRAKLELRQPNIMKINTPTYIG
jgi:hypothetical protein